MLLPVGRDKQLMRVIQLFKSLKVVPYFQDKGGGGNTFTQPCCFSVVAIGSGLILGRLGFSKQFCF